MQNNIFTPKVSKLKFESDVTKKVAGFEITLVGYELGSCKIQVKTPDGNMTDIPLSKGLLYNNKDLGLGLKLTAINGTWLFLEVTFHNIQDNTLKARRERALVEVEELKNENARLQAYCETTESVFNCYPKICEAFDKARRKVIKIPVRKKAGSSFYGGRVQIGRIIDIGEGNYSAAVSIDGEAIQLDERRGFDLDDNFFIAKKVTKSHVTIQLQCVRPKKKKGKKKKRKKKGNNKDWKNLNHSWYSSYDLKSQDSAMRGFCFYIKLFKKYFINKIVSKHIKVDSFLYVIINIQSDLNSEWRRIFRRKWWIEI